MNVQVVKMLNKDGVYSPVNRHMVGTNYARKIKVLGLIPAVIYAGSETINISVDEKCFTNAFAKNALLSRIFDIEIDGKMAKVAVKDYQINHITQSVIHVDFIKLDKEKYSKFKIPLCFINKGKSIAVKKGAVFNVVTYYIFLNCLNDEIPQHLIVDLENSDVLDKYCVENLDLPKSAKIVKPGQLLANFKGKRGQDLKADEK